MTFPSVTEAENYLKSKLQEFFNQTWELKAQMQRIGALKNQAIANNDQPAIGKLILAMEQTKTLMNEQLALERQLAPFADYFGISYTLNAMPLILAGAAVAVASALYLHFEKLRNQKQALDMIAAGMLDPAKAESILNAPLFTLGSLGGSMALPFVGLAVLYFFFIKGGSR